MKLYIKTSNLKTLKNIDTLVQENFSQLSFYIDEFSHYDYKANLLGAKELSKHKKELFYDDRGLDKLIKGVYFGNSSCEHLLPSIADIVEAKKICDKRHLNFVFVFGAMSEFMSEDVEFILKFLANNPQSEVVVNDIGTLHLALQYKLKPILGLNFTKIIKNSFIDSIKPNNLSSTQLNNQHKLLTHSEFEIDEVREFYKELGVGRISVENTDIDLIFLDKKPKLQLDFYYPYITIANSKACDIASSFEDARGYFVHENCSKYCNFASLEFKHTQVLNLRQRYNTVYKTNFAIELDKSVYKDKKNRFIWEVFL
jgi:hypothetical protein